MSYNILLASKSPRRKQLLTESGFDFEILSIDADESFPDTMPVREVAEFLARKKAEFAIDYLQEGQMIITADTTVVFGDTILNKPEGEADAFRMLKLLSGQVHEVVTGVCLATTRTLASFSDVSEVKFLSPPDEEILRYIKTCKPFDKAGSYGVQEWWGHTQIEWIKGSYTNVMGLPMQKLYHALKSYNVQ